MSIWLIILAPFLTLDNFVKHVMADEEVSTGFIEPAA